MVRGENVPDLSGCHPISGLIDGQADEIDAAISNQESVYRERPNEQPGGDEHSSGRKAVDDLGKLVEVSRKALDDGRQLQYEEVRG